MKRNINNYVDAATARFQCGTKNARPCVKKLNHVITEKNKYTDKARSFITKIDVVPKTIKSYTHTNSLKYRKNMKLTINLTFEKSLSKKKREREKRGFPECH